MTPSRTAAERRAALLDVVRARDERVSRGGAREGEHSVTLPAPHFASVRDAAREYIGRGWQVVPLAKGTKQPEDKSWLKLVFKPEDFRPDDNIGIRSVTGLVDVDCDAPEVVAIASEFLPATGAIYGRPGKPRSHWLYLSPFEKTVVFKDLNRKADDKATLIEIRVNHQSMAPPSVHPSGEVLGWAEFGTPSAREHDPVYRAVQLIGTAALVIRYYNPPGNRHDWCLALAGALLRLGLTEEETLKVVTIAAREARDIEVKDRLQEVRSTYAHDDEEPLKAQKALKESMGDVGAMFVKSIERIWGSASSGFLRNDKDKILADSQENIRRAVAKLGATLAYDTFAQRACARWEEYAGPLDDDIRDDIWLAIDAKFGFRSSAELFDRVIKHLARENTYHPVRDYLRSLTWDGVSRVDQWLTLYGKAADSEYTRAVGSLFLIAAVRRVRHPGCKFDELLVLESEQGKNKSSALRALCPNEDWFSDDVPLGVESKQVIERTQGKWILEAAELIGRHTDIDRLKSMLSRQVDGPCRLAYARLPVERPRQFVVIGTTNAHSYLKDATGNRRFWPVRVEHFEVAALRRDRDQLWAEAAHREEQDASIRLEPRLYKFAELQQERRREEDPWESPLNAAFGDPDKALRLTPQEVWMALGILVERRDPKGQKRVLDIMQRLGFRRMSVRDEDGKVCWGWARDARQGTLATESEGEG